MVLEEALLLEGEDEGTRVDVLVETQVFPSVVFLDDLVDRRRLLDGLMNRL